MITRHHWEIQGKRGPSRAAVGADEWPGAAWRQVRQGGVGWGGQWEVKPGRGVGFSGFPEDWAVTLSGLQGCRGL